MSHRTRTAPDCEAVEGVPDFLLLDHVELLQLLDLRLGQRRSWRLLSQRGTHRGQYGREGNEKIALSP